jgi:hypothetical protein
MTDGVNIAFSPAVARVPRGRVSPQADRGGASFRGKISFTIGALSWSRAPRHSPNFMDWKMGASLSLIPELEEVVQHGSRQKRVETLRRITALFLDGARSYNDQHVGLFDDVFGILIEEIEAKARAELANRLAPVGNAPVNVLRRLAQDDDIAVAGPVLKLASRLPEDDLVGVARTKSQAHLQAISACPTLGEAVTDELVRRGDREVALRIADNRGARISKTGFSRLIERAEKDGTLAEKVGLRPDIPAPMFRELLTKATRLGQARLQRGNPAGAGKGVAGGRHAGGAARLRRRPAHGAEPRSGRAPDRGGARFILQRGQVRGSGGGAGGPRQSADPGRRSAHGRRAARSDPDPGQSRRPELGDGEGIDHGAP